ncbi:MAG: PadR family transcriptional regulator [bacterium]|nr:PadR family transcriptional regulator [bacterium]
MLRMLSKPEELVLLTVWLLKDDAYGVTIRKNIIKETGQEWSVGAVYVPLGRLTKWGYLETSIGEPTAERGGKRKKYYRITDIGIKALAHIKKVNESMWSNVTDMELEKGI